MKANYLKHITLIILLLTGYQLVARDSQPSIQAKDRACSSETFAKSINSHEGSTSDLTSNQEIGDEKFIKTKSPLQRAVIREGFARGKSRAYQLSSRENPSALKHSYRKSSIGRRAPSEFSLYYEAYQRGYKQALNGGVYQLAKDLGSQAGQKAKSLGKKRPSLGSIRFQAVHNHPEWEGNEQAVQAYTQSFYAHYSSPKGR